jgi:small subunit ribosomal protein S17
MATKNDQNAATGPVARIKEMVKSTLGIGEPAAGQQRKRTTKIGVVVSNKMDKTVVVAVENMVMHEMYHKYIKRTSKFMAHNEANDCKVGDRVVIEETRPLSKRKRWNVREVIARQS